MTKWGLCLVLVTIASACGDYDTGSGGARTGGLDGFMESPGHCANIMSPEFSVVGIGVHGDSWTQSFSN
jgi:uncharacterized protein YkwD